MAGFIIPGQRYQDPATGQWGTAQEHAARKTQEQNQRTYDVDKPSAPAANAAAQQANPNLDYTVGPSGQLSYTNQSAQQRMLAEQQAKAAAAAAQGGYANQTTQAQLQARLAAEAAKGSYANQTAQTQLQAKLAAEAEARRLAAVRGLAGTFGGGITGGNPTPGMPTVPYGGGPGMSAQEDAVRAGAFARAKDQTGELAASQLRGVQGEMAGRGLSGSPLEALRSAGVMGGARGGLDQVIQQQLLQDLARASEVANLQYQGGITQRGQDLNAQASQRQALLQLFGQLY
jgi:hypothetical protein